MSKEGLTEFDSKTSCYANRIPGLEYFKAINTILAEDIRSGKYPQVINIWGPPKLVERDLFAVSIPSTIEEKDYMPLPRSLRCSAGMHIHSLDTTYRAGHK